MLWIVTFPLSTQHENIVTDNPALRELMQMRYSLKRSMPLLLTAAISAAGITAWLFWTTWAAISEEIPSVFESEAMTASVEPISPIPESISLDERKVALGKRLFHDVRLSHDDSVACANCHSLKKGGVDGLAHSVGIHGSVGDTNAPTVFNSGFSFRQFWDGRRETLEDQIDGPVENSKEMDSNWVEIIAKLNKDAPYVAEFSRIYSKGISPANIKDAIATFERSLITPNSRFDQYLKGNSSALTREEIQGYRLFKNYGCASCHQGVNVGGNLFAKLGVMRIYIQDANVTSADLGRFKVTGRPTDRLVFKVPSLRMAALTAPYFHDGSVKTLEHAIELMGVYQLGISIPLEDVARIASFLRTLPGTYAGASP
jgi:cytochrome c peroxidase